MNLSTEQLAELLAGIARAQQAIVDAIESESGGFRSTHMLPKITTAANMRLATPRLVDIPSRVLLRSQSRVPMDTVAIVRMLEEATQGSAGAVAASPAKITTPVAAAAVVGAVAAGAAVAPVAEATPASSSESTPVAGADDLSSFFDS